MSHSYPKQNCVTDDRGVETNNECVKRTLARFLTNQGQSNQTPCVKRKHFLTCRYDRSFLQGY